jgi:hypothetical protein
VRHAGEHEPVVMVCGGGRGDGGLGEGGGRGHGGGRAGVGVGGGGGQQAGGEDGAPRHRPPTTRAGPLPVSATPK